MKTDPLYVQLPAQLLLDVRVHATKKRLSLKEVTDAALRYWLAIESHEGDYCPICEQTYKGAYPLTAYIL